MFIILKNDSALNTCGALRFLRFNQEQLRAETLFELSTLCEWFDKDEVDSIAQSINMDDVDVLPVPKILLGE